MAKQKPDLSYAFGLPPEKAIEYFKSKGYTFSWNWQDTWQEAHAKAFTVAKAMRLDVLQDIRGEVQKALDEGITFQQFKKELTPKLQAKGWWGKKLVGDEQGGQEVQLGSPRRLQTIYQTNLQTAYMAGRYKEMAENVEDRPYWQYVAVLDSKTRPAHRALNGKVFRYDDPFWHSFYPPNGWNCRCRVRALSVADVKDRGVEISKGDDYLREEEVLISKTTGEKTNVMVYTDPKTGRDIYPDAGWSYNPGEAAWQPNWSKYPKEMKGIVDQAKNEIDIAAAKLKPLDPLDLKAIPNTQKGSNPGGLYEDSSGTRYYVKFYKDERQAQTEYTATKIHSLMGLETPEINLLRMADPKGKERLAVVSKWMDGLKRLSQEEMLVYKEDLARIFQSSALVKNWDCVGLEYDNIMLTKEGRLVVIDTGGSFKFRAQGSAKVFDAIPLEVKTFLDPKINPQAAKVFSDLFKSDVFLEAEGAKPLLDLKKTSLSGIFKESGFAAGEWKELEETIWKRREWLVDRYNLDGIYTPKGFGSHLEEFKKWGTGAWTPKVVNGMVQGSLDPGFQKEMEGLVTKFEEYINGTINKYSRGVLRGLFSEWSGSSSSTGAATIKEWAQQRFGVLVNYHRGNTDLRQITTTLNDDMALSLAKAKLDKDTVLKILDAEYEFNQYYLRRLHGYNEVVSMRYIRDSEFQANFGNNSWQGNAVQSTTVRKGGFSNQRAIQTSFRVEDTVKTFHQGIKYMYYGSGESEYITIGRKVSAKIIK